jgi:hypothetical protein
VWVIISPQQAQMGGAIKDASRWQSIHQREPIFSQPPQRGG